MIIARLDDFEIEWAAGAVSVRPDVGAEIEADERGAVARAGLAVACLKMQAEVDRRMGSFVYDPSAFESDDRPFRIPPGSADHARLVLAGLGATVELDFADVDDDMAILFGEIDR